MTQQYLTPSIVRSFSNMFNREDLEKILMRNQAFYIVDSLSLKVKKYYYQGRLNGVFLVANQPVTMEGASSREFEIIGIRHLDVEIRNSIKLRSMSERFILVSEKSALMLVSSILKLRSERAIKKCESLSDPDMAEYVCNKFDGIKRETADGYVSTYTARLGGSADFVEISQKAESPKLHLKMGGEILLATDSVEQVVTEIEVMLAT